MVTSRRQTAACLLLLLCAVCCLSGVAVSGEQEAATGSQTRQTQTQAQTQTQTTPIETATATADDDLDNSIRQADAARTAQADDNSGEQDKRVEKNKDKTGIEAPAESNDLAPTSGHGQADWQLGQDHHFHHQLERHEAATKLLSRRLDLLEFELRKTILLLHHQMRIKPPLPTDDSDSGKQDEPALQQQHSTNNKSQLQLEALADSSSRLELMEKFITVTTKKLYETEQRVKQLERCDCKLKCNWMQPADVSQQQRQQNQTALVKMDGQVWQHKCDVCSCNRGHVRCRHVACPRAECPEPSYAPGRCCPVCHKNCSFGGQTVKHGHKLVINSKQNTCKECLCSDGRLKCHRVEQLELAAAELVASSSGATTSTQPRDERASSGRQANLQLRVQRSTPIDLGLDFALGSLADTSTGGGRRHSGGSGEPLVCPQIDCKLEQQIRLSNDCCTYCRGFDFCSLRGSFANCHPAAVCLLSSNNSLASQEEIDERSLTLSSMFECRCAPGFSGNGRFCHDIDECARRQLNDCDPRTSYCVNLAGSYQCKCRPGFREPPAVDDDEESAPKLSTDAAEGETTTTTTRKKLKSCRDVNECSDGTLNRCHQQAKCVNLMGSYKCQCKRGYLGNGFECHQWFSSQPGVAAYLHRHSSIADGGNGSTMSANNASSAPRLALSVPLSSLFDPDDDRSDVARKELDADEYKYDEEADAAEELIDGDRAGSSSPADLADSRWEPLRFPEQANVFQQTDGLVGASQQVWRHRQTGEDNAPSNGHQTTVAAAATTTTELPVPFVSSLNTRTMFFQPPPRFRPPLNTTTTTTANSITPPILPGDSMTSPTTTTATTMTSNHYDRLASDMRTTTTTSKSQPSSESAKQTTSPLQSEPAASVHEQPRAGDLANSSQQLLRKGSIIASATTSPIRGFGHNSNQYRHASQPQHRNLFHHQQKALRSSSPSPSPSSGASSLYGDPAINYLAKVNFLATTQTHSFVGPRFGVNLVLTLIATVLQVLFLF